MCMALVACSLLFFSVHTLLPFFFPLLTIITAFGRHGPKTFPLCFLLLRLDGNLSTHTVAICWVERDWKLPRRLGRLQLPATVWGFQSHPLFPTHATVPCFWWLPIRPGWELGSPHAFGLSIIIIAVLGWFIIGMASGMAYGTLC